MNKRSLTKRVLLPLGNLLSFPLSPSCTAPKPGKHRSDKVYINHTALLCPAILFTECYYRLTPLLWNESSSQPWYNCYSILGCLFPNLPSRFLALLCILVCSSAPGIITQANEATLGHKKCPLSSRGGEAFPLAAHPPLYYRSYSEVLTRKDTLAKV